MLRFVCLLKSENLHFSTHLVKFFHYSFKYISALFSLFSDGDPIVHIFDLELFFSQITEVCSLFKNNFVFQIEHKNLSVSAQLAFWVRSLVFVCGTHFPCAASCLAASLASVATCQRHSPPAGDRQCPRHFQMSRGHKSNSS